MEYEDNNDQSLSLEIPVLSNVDLQRYFVDFPIDPMASPDNDFVENVFRLLPDDDGVWRVSVSAEFQVSGTDDWVDGHKIEFRLYRNGVFERLIDQLVVDTALFDPTDTNPKVLLRNDVLSDVLEGDILQVRVFTLRPATDPSDPSGPAPNYDVEVTGESEKNWVSFERIDD